MSPVTQLHGGARVGQFTELEGRFTVLVRKQRWLHVLIDLCQTSGKAFRLVTEVCPTVDRMWTYWSGSLPDPIEVSRTVNGG
jgi:hypothetical protein